MIRIYKLHTTHHEQMLKNIYIDRWYDRYFGWCRYRRSSPSTEIDIIAETLDEMTDVLIALG